ncbi:MAG TPA: hypothetical protein VEG31_02725 [Thermoproteota archaeon]|nr:hypothetical protein [Thermoproteota archaeon]
MKIEYGRLFLLLAIFFLADLVCTIFSLAWGIPGTLPSNWAFLASLAVTHFIASLACTYGTRDKAFAIGSAIACAAFAYVLFCALSVDIDLLVRSAVPLSSLELGALLGATFSRSSTVATTRELSSPPPVPSSA